MQRDLRDPGRDRAEHEPSAERAGPLAHDPYAEAGTTIVPTEYVVLKALSIIYMQLSNSNRADRQHLRQQATDYEAMAIAYAMKNAFAQPAETLWMESDLGAPRAGYSEDHNPLGWG